MTKTATYIEGTGQATPKSNGTYGANSLRRTIELNLNTILLSMHRMEQRYIVDAKYPLEAPLQTPVLSLCPEIT
jgi:hypothetical protein